MIEKLSIFLKKISLLSSKATRWILLKVPRLTTAQAIQNENDRPIKNNLGSSWLSCISRQRSITVTVSLKVLALFISSWAAARADSIG